MQTILSYGMGVESSAIRVRWLEEPRTRPCALEDPVRDHRPIVKQ